MAHFALYRSMHTLRGTEPKPTRTVLLDAEEAAALQELGFGRTQAWSLHGLTGLLDELAAHFQLTRSEVVQATCREAGLSALPENLRPAVAARLEAIPRARALRLALEIGREAMNHQMTLAYRPE